ncbi:hypothetical protein [uncultured Desulfosarcina sp.]|uniref:substrate-binding periplasmic protein n=1 Tax=uncultured Desulfosarcina sp. TaxID=218289 RepID=UPI0029C7E1F4|nr:hypothetical protein [uncultured Desulfosarcina sp.]
MASQIIHKSKVFLIVFLCSLSFPNQAAAADPIRMGYFVLPPHHYLGPDNSKPIGAGIEYFETLMSKTGNTVKWVGPFPLLRLFQKLETGEIEGTIGLPHYSQFDAYLYYVKTPMFLAKPILVVRKGNPLEKITSADAIRGWRIGMISSRSGIYTPFIDNNRDKFSIETIGGNGWAEANLKKLLMGRLEAVSDRNQFTLPFVAAKMNMHSRIKVLYVPDPPTPMYVTFSKVSKRSRTLTEKYNYTLSLLNLDYGQMAQREIDAIID